MTAIIEASQRSEFVPVGSAFEVPELLAPDWDPLARTLD
jgi:hypothetical protein